jgi:Putative Ig domain/Immunoglobulin domain/Immunoglobulin I-set domain
MRSDKVNPGNRTQGSFHKIWSVFEGGVLLSAAALAASVLSGCTGLASSSPNSGSVPPAIGTQPVNQTVTAGQTATFTVLATGTAPLGYQWQKNGGNVAGAISASYVTPATTPADSGATFRVVVSNAAGTMTSAAATLTVNAAATAPSINTQPVNQTVTAGQTATFSVVATGTAPLSYQWNKNGAAISGAVSSTYTTPAATSSDNGAQFTLLVSNSAGSVTSTAATLTVNATAVAPAITTQPANQTVTAGQTATFSVVATGTPPLSYQWQKNGANVTGATSPTYTTAATTTADSGAKFDVVVSNTAGTVTSTSATLTVSAGAVAPAITTQPANQTVTVGQTATFSVVATGTAPLSYQWQENAANITGATSSSYTTSATTTADNGAKFDVVVSNTLGSVTSNSVSLTVNAASTLAITTTSLPNGTVGQTYSTQLTATGGTPPYTWSVSSGSLPAGLSLSAAGLITGTPTTAVSPTLTLSVSDTSSRTASSNFTLTIGNPTATACTLYVSPSGSDSNSGTLSAPWQTPQQAANNAAAGQTVCFRGGSYPQTVTSGYQQTFSKSGSAGNPIIFTNYPGEIAVIQGSTRINGSYLTFRGTPQGAGSCDAINHCGLVFEGSQGYNIDAIDICCAVNSNSNFVQFDHVEIRKATYHAGLYQEGCNNSIVGSYVHDNGAFNANRSEDNGIYWSVTPAGCTNGGLIANNLVENNYSKGIQLYDGGSATSPAYVTVTENTSVNNGAQGAVVWGDHNIFVNNILYNNNNLSGGAAAGAQGGLYSGATNLVDHNLTFDPTGNSGWDNPGGCCLTNGQQGDPLFLSPSGLDWHILTTSPAIGFSNMNYIQPVDKDGVSRGSSPAAGAYQQ